MHAGAAEIGIVAKRAYTLTHGCLLSITKAGKQVCTMESKWADNFVGLWLSNTEDILCLSLIICSW